MQTPDEVESQDKTATGFSTGENIQMYRSTDQPNFSDAESMAIESEQKIQTEKTDDTLESQPETQNNQKNSMQKSSF